MAKSEREYIVRIGPTDRYRHTHIKERGKIVFFRVQYETKIDNVWQAVVRYDTAHGFAHRDLLKKDGTIAKTPLFNQDYNDALTFAENDLKSNWRYYKKRFSEESDEFWSERKRANTMIFPTLRIEDPDSAPGSFNKENQLIDRNIELSAEFSRFLFEHPEIEEKIPAGAEIILLPEVDKELRAFNMRLGKEIEAEGGKVAYVSIKSMLPRSLSRIESIELESVA